MYEAVQRENAWDDEACGDRIARVDVVDDVCGMVIHFIEVRNADENRWVLRPGARWLIETAKVNGVATLRDLRDHRPG
jgi:hypothetical protein